MRVTLRDAARLVKWARHTVARCAATAAILLLASSTAAPAGVPEVGAGAVPLFLEPTPLGDVSYTPGWGLRLGRTGVTLGGYGNANLSRPEGDPARLGLDDLSFFVTWAPTARLQLFSELEFEDLLEVTDEGHGGTESWQFTVERLYGDVALTDQLALRVGKFLTPVGRWNLIHAQPLVWTASRPLVTELPFDPHSTGAMVFGSFYPAHGTLSYSVYGQFEDQFQPVPVPQPAQRSVGGRLEYSDLLGWSIGASLQGAQHDGNWRQLAGVDGLWRRGPVELMGEATVEDGQRPTEDQWGLYLQGVVEVWPRVFLVGRYEHYAWRRGPQDVDMVVGGLAFKPAPWLILKTEYLAADHRAEEEPPGFRASIAVLF